MGWLNNKMIKSKKPIYTKNDFAKFQRSLELLGLQSLKSSNDNNNDKRKSVRKVFTPSLSTPSRLFSRSISLQQLHEVVREAWAEDRIDPSLRRLLVQAAFEEWYSKKKKEQAMKQGEESSKKKEMKKKMEKDFESKRVKAKQEYSKWLKKKHIHKTQKSIKKLSSTIKSKDESEKAFKKWKKDKDKQLKAKKKEIKMEQQKKVEQEREKEKKKILAKRAFQQWTSKIKKIKKLDVKSQAKKTGKPMKAEYKYQKSSENELTFFAWKKAKDKEIAVKAKQNRESVKLAREKYLTLVEERLHRAHQAFENWLENVDDRKKKQLCNNKILCKRKPWLPL